MSDPVRPHEEREELLRRLRVTYWKIFQALEDEREIQGLTCRQLLCLDLLGQEGPLSGRMLSSSLGMTPANITRLSVPLESKQWIRRVRDPDDHRRLLISLTAQGKSVLRAEMGRHQRRLSELLGCLTSAELATTVRGLQGFIGALEAPTPKRGRRPGPKAPGAHRGRSPANG